MNAAKTPSGLVKAAQEINSQKWTFLVVFLVLLIIVVRICVATGFIPNNSDAQKDQSITATSNVTLNNSPLAAVVPLTVQTDSSSAASEQSASQGTPATTERAHTAGGLNMNGELPTKIVVPSIGLSAKISNPATTDVNTLDQYLLTGADRYPTSATLDQPGNVILFGHSSYLPVVINHAYKTFDGIQKLKTGDLITVYSNADVFTYSVTGVQQQSATSDGIALTTTGHTLTLATCDSFGKKSDRFVVTATLVGSSALGS